MLCKGIRKGNSRAWTPEGCPGKQGVRGSGRREVPSKMMGMSRVPREQTYLHQTLHRRPASNPVGGRRGKKAH